jgi:DNA replication licensing factor MCM2
MLSATTSKSR